MIDGDPREDGVPLAVRFGAHPFLRDLDEAHLKILADCAMESQFERAELIFREGDPANRFYLIQSGRVSLEVAPKDGPPVVLETIGPGEVLGWSWLFPPYCWHFNARALEPTRAIFFYGTRLREACGQNHDLGYELMKRMTEVVIQRLQSLRRCHVAQRQPKQN